MKKVAGKAWRVLQVVSWAWRVLGVWSSLLLVTEATGKQWRAQDSIPIAGVKGRARRDGFKI